MQSQLKPHLWTIVISYYAMFYMANAVLLMYGYKTQDKIAHKVTSDALIVLVLDKLKKQLIEDYESMQKDALEIAGAKAESVIDRIHLSLTSDHDFSTICLMKQKKTKPRLRFSVLPSLCLN